MKKLLLIPFVFCVIFANAQVKQKKDEKSLDEMLRNVDQSTFKSGILYDRTTPYAALTKFNAPENKEAASYAYFRQALLEMHNASNKKYFISSTALREKQKSKKKNDAVDIGIINVSYEVLNYNDSDNPEGALRFTQNKFKVINDAPPFTSHHGLVIAPLKRGTYGPKVTFQLAEQYWFKNATSKKIKKLTVDTGNGKIETLIQNNNIVKPVFTGTYQTSGTKVLTFKGFYDDGSTLETKGEIYVVVNKSGVACTDNVFAVENGIVTTDIAFKGYDESVALLGKSQYRILYRTNEQIKPYNIKKPIIIIDGFDPLDHRRIQDCDCAADPDCASLSKYKTNNVFDPEKHHSIEDFNDYRDNSGMTKNVISDLRADGYDVVLVNHPKYTTNAHEIVGGGDYIERNGLVLTKLIRELNARVFGKGLVIVGPSMGGQISRYALAYMEKKYAETGQAQWQHNTRLWISVDSPHLGANIPVGIQALLNMAKDDSDGAKEFVEKWLGSPAAKQQLIEQFTDFNNNNMNARTTSQGFSLTRGHPFFIQYYNNLFGNGLPNSNGYPQNLRKIALVNGSLIGSRAYDNPFEVNGYELSGTIRPDNFANHHEQSLKIKGFNDDLWFDTHVASLESYFMPAYGEGLHKIAYFKQGFNKHTIYTNNPNSRGNMDNVSGGWFPAQQEVAKSTFEGHRPQGLNFWSLRTLKHVNSFISSFSALGHKNPDQNWASPLNYNLVCANDTPFDSYYGHKKNTQHTSFNQKSVDWIFQELGGAEQDPTVYLDNSDLMGDDAICLNENVTYHFDGCKVPGNTTWEVTNLQIISSTNTSITVRVTSPYVTQGTIKANFLNGLIVEKTIILPGDPVVYIPTNSEGEMIYELCSGQGTFITLINEDEVEVDLSNGVEIIPEVDNFDYQIMGNEILITPDLYANDIFFTIKVKNHCGTWPEEERYMYFVVLNCSSYYSSNYKIYPNPVSSTLTIENVKSKVENYNKNASFQLSDDYGNVIHRGRVQALSTLNLSNYRNGIYILKIISDSNVETHKIMVEHGEK